MERIGILGGMFNPPHLGHLSLARHARQELRLDEVLLVPANLSPQKRVEDDPGPSHRLRMCELLVDRSDGLSTCALELERGGRSYTVDTLKAMRASHPDAQLTLIVGADAASTLASWRQPAQILELAQLAVADRGCSEDRRALDALAELGFGPGGLPATQTGNGDGQRVRRLQMPVIEISSSVVRRRVAHGQSIEDLVGPAIAGYITQEGLYRPDGQVG